MSNAPTQRDKDLYIFSTITVKGDGVRTERNAQAVRAMLDEQISEHHGDELYMDRLFVDIWCPVNSQDEGYEMIYHCWFAFYGADALEMHEKRETTQKCIRMREEQGLFEQDFEKLEPVEFRKKLEEFRFSGEYKQWHSAGTLKFHLYSSDTDRDGGVDLDTEYSPVSVPSASTGYSEKVEPVDLSLPPANPLV